MIESEFEKVKEYLRHKLPDYLHNKGINPNAKFACLNPEHHENLPSMSYNPQDCTVKCFSCQASYDIFDLIGIDYGFSDFKPCFIKAHELFIGPVPQVFNELLSQEDSATEYDNSSYIHNHYAKEVPEFEIAQDFTPQPSAQSYPARENGNAGFSFVPNPANNAPNSYSGSSNSYSHPRQSGVVFGGENFNFVAPSRNNQRLNLNNGFTGTGEHSAYEGPRPEENRPNFSEYFKNCSSQLNKTDYYALRGISQEVVERFHLGYDDHFIAGVDQMGVQQLWRAAIVPLSEYSYLVRNTDRNAQDRMRKKGQFEIFNREALNHNGIVFVTEGEFDALSLETLGYRAISIGGAANARRLLEIIKEQYHGVEERCFYLCLDNDEQGQEAEKVIATGLYQYRIAYKRLNLAFPYKDINEALVKNKDGLAYKLTHLEQMLSYKLGSLTEPKRSLKLSKWEDFNRLMSGEAALYTICGRPNVLRHLLSRLITERMGSVVYAGQVNQWQYISNLVERPQGAEYTQGYFTAQFLEVNSSDIIGDVDRALNALRLRGRGNFVTYVDLSGKSLENCLEYVEQLGRLSEQAGLPIVAMCNQEPSEYVEAVALQNLELAFNDKGDLVFYTVDDQGKPFKFYRYQ
ncbi:MAG: toprim domain-containing protein [Succinivibrio sp.]|nr:toprim domain-containing protein [Succinivibrio sp.]